MAKTNATDRHRLATDLLMQVVELPVAQHEAWLSVNVSDADLRENVRSLATSHMLAEQDEAFENPVFGVRVTGRTDGPLLDADEQGLRLPDPRTGTQVGPWLLTERIGTGGMGAVYKASRCDGAYERTVAVKVLHPDRETGALSRLLDAEARVLARLEHPGIARLYDAGLSAKSEPYIAMAFVRGEPITDVVRNLQMSVRDRVGLFFEVCAAVAHAHRNLVVHRDIKPSNVFVTPEGSPVLLDFGIARLLDETSRSEPTVLQTEIGALTPAYAAPEQIRREPVTFATDVYALGVLLYELLAGSRPYDLSDLTASQIERVLCDEVPKPPSILAPPNDRHAIAGDLDTIVLKALEKDPLRRYASAETLGQDLQRHLDGLPVMARPATVSYRTGSFVRRHRLGVLSTALIAIALFTGLGVSLWQASVASAERDRAERRFGIARETVQSLLFDTHDAIAGLPGATAARELIVTRALDFLQRMSADSEDDPSLQLDLARAYQRVADVQGNPTNSNLGRTDDAVTSYLKGLAILPRTDAVPDSLVNQVRYTRGAILGSLGDLVAFTVGPDSALTYQRRSTRLFAANVQDHPDDADALAALATALLIEGDYTGNPNFPNADRPNDALLLYERSSVLLNQALALNPDHPKGLRMLGNVHERRGSVYERLDQRPAALEAYRLSMTVREKLASAPDANVETRRNLGIAHEKLGLTYQSYGQLRNARIELDSAQRIYAAIAQADPDDANARLTVAIGEMNLGALAWSREIPSERNATLSREHYARAVGALTALAAADPSNQRTKSVLTEAVEALNDR